MGTRRERGAKCASAAVRLFFPLAARVSENSLLLIERFSLRLRRRVRRKRTRFVPLQL